MKQPEFWIICKVFLLQEVLWRFCVDFEAFRVTIDAGLKYSCSKKGGRSPYDLMFKVLILTAQHER